jgi:transposase
MLDMENFPMLRDLFKQGLSISEIARKTCHSRVTVRKYMHSQVPPTPEKRSKGPRKLDDYNEYIDLRINCQYIINIYIMCANPVVNGLRSYCLCSLIQPTEMYIRTTHLIRKTLAW